MLLLNIREETTRPVAVYILQVLQCYVRSPVWKETQLVYDQPALDDPTHTYIDTLTFKDCADVLLETET